MLVANDEATVRSSWVFAVCLGSGPLYLSDGPCFVYMILVPETDRGSKNHKALFEDLRVAETHILKLLGHFKETKVVRPDL